MKKLFIIAALVIISSFNIEPEQLWQCAAVRRTNQSDETLVAIVAARNRNIAIAIFDRWVLKSSDDKKTPIDKRPNRYMVDPITEASIIRK